MAEAREEEEARRLLLDGLKWGHWYEVPHVIKLVGDVPYAHLKQREWFVLSVQRLSSPSFSPVMERSTGCHLFHWELGRWYLM